TLVSRQHNTTVSPVPCSSSHSEIVVALQMRRVIYLFFRNSGSTLDAPVIFYFYFYFLRTSSARRGRGRAARLSFSFFPCSADHERDWPQCKVVFFGLATNALNVRNNNKRGLYLQPLIP
ncbi:unnamed protein product, partial [Ascophyllum nodosum]